MKITQYRLAKTIGVDARRIHSIVRGEAGHYCGDGFAVGVLFW